MKVSELIELLKEMPQEAEVIIHHDGYYVEDEFPEIDEPVLTKDGRVQLAYLNCRP